MRLSLCFCLLAAVAAAQTPVTIDLSAARDNTLYEDASGGLSNGQGGQLFAGLTVISELRRGLIAFDVAGSVPSGATVIAAELLLEMNRTIVGDMAVSVHRVAAAWGEGSSNASGQEGRGTASQPGDATWLHRFYPTDFWATPGGDFATTPSAVLGVDQPDRYGWKASSDLIADVQGWLDQPQTNHGWAILANETTISAKRFASRENSFASERPVLRLTYTLGQAGAVNASGPGCGLPGSLFSCRLFANGLPTLGNAAFTLRVRDAVPNASVEFYLASALSGTNPSASAAGCPIWLELASAISLINSGISPVSGFLADAAGDFELGVPIGTDPSLAGTSLAIQVITTDSLSFATSNGLQLVLN